MWKIPSCVDLTNIKPDSTSDHCAESIPRAQCAPNGIGLMDLQHRTIDELAAELPGAAEVFHRHRIDVCSGGAASVRRAAVARGVDPEILSAELEALRTREPAVPADSNGLIAYILTRYHETHLREFPEAVRLARMVEIVHRHSDDCPHGLADHLAAMAQDLEHHQQKEEAVLFPLMLASGGPMLRFPIARMNAKHEGVERWLAVLSSLTNGLAAPAGARGSWSALYALGRKITDDLREHMRVETEILFPRFDTSGV
jgi:regulator of cell morphogenesis and NO signaling